jgi:hypothetical protein
MNAQLPKYMPIRDFCAFSGFSRYQFMRLVNKADKAGISIKSLGDDWRSKMVDVQKAIAAIEALPEADKEVPVNLRNLEERARYHNPVPQKEKEADKEVPINLQVQERT